VRSLSFVNDAAAPPHVGVTETAREGEVCWACCEIKVLLAGRLAYWTRALLDSQKSMHIRRRTEILDGCF
jgi:hypothetical protein